MGENHLNSTQSTPHLSPNSPSTSADEQSGRKWKTRQNPANNIIKGIGVRNFEIFGETQVDRNFIACSSSHHPRQPWRFSLCMASMSHHGSLRHDLKSCAMAVVTASYCIAPAFRKDNVSDNMYIQTIINVRKAMESYLQCDHQDGCES